MKQNNKDSNMRTKSFFLEPNLFISHLKGDENNDDQDDLFVKVENFRNQHTQSFTYEFPGNTAKKSQNSSKHKFVL